MSVASCVEQSNILKNTSCVTSGHRKKTTKYKLDWKRHLMPDNEMFTNSYSWTTRENPQLFEADQQHRPSHWLSQERVLRNSSVQPLVPFPVAHLKPMSTTTLTDIITGFFIFGIVFYYRAQLRRFSVFFCFPLLFFCKCVHVLRARPREDHQTRRRSTNACNPATGNTFSSPITVFCRFPNCTVST